jgi:hypothetical protein
MNIAFESHKDASSEGTARKEMHGDSAYKS